LSIQKQGLVTQSSGRCIVTDIDRLVADLRQARDEIHLRLHLASMDAREEWEALESRWEDFTARANVDETTEGVGEALKQLADELREGYRRIRAALRD
jgi:hypothetical protein